MSFLDRMHQLKPVSSHLQYLPAAEARAEWKRLKVDDRILTDEEQYRLGVPNMRHDDWHYELAQMQVAEMDEDLRKLVYGRSASWAGFEEVLELQRLRLLSQLVSAVKQGNDGGNR